jgi:transposase
MGRKAQPIECDEKQRKGLEQLARSRSKPRQQVERARMVLGCVEGSEVKEVAARCHTRPNTVIKWRQRFATQGMDGLRDAPRAGTRRIYDEAFRNRVLATLEKPAPAGQAAWDGPSVAAQLNSSKDAVWRVLRKEGICLQRQRTWCVSTDKQFAAKAADIVGLYLNPPHKALVVSVDEKPSIQALERRRGYVQTGSGKIVQALKSTYKRHGTLNLFAALHVASGQVSTRQTKTKKRDDFLSFMEEIAAGCPEQSELHVILDNYCTHKKCDDWLRKHPRVHFHYTPTSASWLNMVEIWFGMLTRKALRHASFESVEELGAAIEAFVAAYTPGAKPFKWRKREVHGSQLRNTIVNLCN